MIYIHVGDSLINFNPDKVKHISLKKTDNGTVLSITSISKYFDDILITFQDHEEAKESFDEIVSLIKEAPVLTMDIHAEHDLSVEFVPKIGKNPAGNVQNDTGSNDD